MLNKTTTDYEVAIIGAGFSGLGMALRLKKERRNSFIIFERTTEIGGTWRDNIYPGCACDVPSHLYSYSFALNPDWSRAYSPQSEILTYMKKVMQENDLEPKVRYNTEIIQLEFNETLGIWNLIAKDGATFSAKIVVSATGPLNRPKFPTIKGLTTFKGKTFHSSEWDTDYDLKDKKVAVIGTGASAIQFVPQIAPDVAQLTVFQRTAPWIIPRPDRKITNFEHRLFKTMPALQRLIRNFLYWRAEFFGLGFIGNQTVSKIGEKRARQHLEGSILDPELRKKVTPNFQIGCKRVLISDDYYPTLLRENVHLETESVVEVRPHSIIVKGGAEYEVDAIIFGTGFIASEVMLNMEVVGKSGKKLLEEWQVNGPEAYFGITISGYPNYLFMVGPNTGLGHNSIIHMIESQVNYMMDYIKILDRTGADYLDLKPEIQKTFNREIQNRLSTTVWQSGGCKSWYQTTDGKNTTLWPGLTVEYRKKTRVVNELDYDKVKVKEPITA